MLASSWFTRTTQRRKHKQKRKEIKLKNSDKLSAYNLVTHALPFSAMLESNLAPKGSPAARLRQIVRQICLVLRLRMSRYAYAYRTCKHPCACACAYAYAYAYACAVRVNQALVRQCGRVVRGPGLKSGVPGSSPVLTASWSCFSVAPSSTPPVCFIVPEKPLSGRG